LTVGGAQTILKSQRILPGKRILMAGTGPLLLVVASQLAKAGAEIVAVAEAVPARALLPHVRGMLSAWSITRDGIGYRWSLLRSRVPWIAPSILTRIEGDQEVERATIARVDENWRPVADTEETFEVDTVCIGYGLVPSIELPRLCGCAVRYDGLADVWVAERDAEFETSVPGVFVVGDGGGVAGAVVAAAEGRIAGATVARRLKGEALQGATERIAEARRHLSRLARFRTAMDTVYRIRPGVHELATQETTICRCEEVRLSELEAAMEDGANSLNQLKAWTRAGMGPCQARMCGLPTAHLLARRTGAPVAELGGYTSRPPVKPVSIGALMGER
jgi:NADPH-dependent 2,4-dienoyl-CoA reductase/sulfur reductase-like enzyme